MGTAAAAIETEALTKRYYGNAIEDGIEPLAFAGVTLFACALAAIGAWLFERRDLAA